MISDLPDPYWWLRAVLHSGTPAPVKSGVDLRFYIDAPINTTHLNNALMFSLHFSLCSHPGVPKCLNNAVKWESVSRTTLQCWTLEAGAVSVL